ncbi:MAG: 7-cyano-7-deazaguanine synthase QueC [Planctomycetota bacterium]
MTDRPRALVLLSGGLDSTVAAYLAADECEVLGALAFDYGQRARRRELGASYAIAADLRIAHRTVELPFFRLLSAGALTEPASELPRPSAGDLDDPEAARASAAAVWVPNRNGVFIAVGAAWAESAGADVLVVGFNAEEARTFPDNGEDFVARQNEALAYSTARGVRVSAPTQRMSKVEIVRVAMERDLPLERAWSCYEGDDKPCGTCESCRRFDRALDAAGARSWYEARRNR